MQDPYLHQILSELLTVLHSACNISSKELECVQDEETKEQWKAKREERISCADIVFLWTVFTVSRGLSYDMFWLHFVECAVWDKTHEPDESIKAYAQGWA